MNFDIFLAGIRYFEHFPEEARCKLCDSNRDEPCILIGVDGTNKDGIEEALPVHLTCMVDNRNWRINRDIGVIYAKWK